MKRFGFGIITLAVCLFAATAHAQQTDADRLKERALQLQKSVEVQKILTMNTAWWTNPATVSRLGLSDDQKTRLERAFENHREKLQSSTVQLKTEEAQLSRLLAAESLDRNAILAEIDRVVQARAEMERANSAMTLEMREVLTAAQWLELQSPKKLWLEPGLPGQRKGGPAPAQGGGRGQRGTPGQQ